jgi:EAL domain-containing protein (putative c-di-GMP-specific phosphodiesterase class I)
MYQAKREGGGRSVLFTPALETKALQLLSLETELEMALRRDEIIAHYQPQIALDGKGISGVEALARWQHPRQGLLEPSEFIPFAESRQIIHRIGFRMIDLALGQLALWDQQGINIPVVAVNVSQSEIKQGLLEVIQSALVRHKIAAHRLEIEITESVLLTDRTRAILVLQQLGELGVRISVDDFGSGNSSLGQLLRLPVDALKIDRSFVSEIPGNKRDCAIIAAISNMARALGLHIVAAGAERADQVALLSAMGCHSVQGLFYTAPLAPHYFGLWCRNFLEQNKAQPDRARMAVLAEGP